MSSTRVRRDLIILFSYLLLALVLTYPLVLHLTTHVAGDGSDDPALAWNLWWVPHALLNLGASPIYTNYMFYPIGLNLSFYTLTYLNAFVAVPIQFVFGLITAANINLFLSFTLSGFGMYLLARKLLASEGHGVTLAAFAAGLVYAFSSSRFLYASLGQFNIASSQWIPFYVLYLIKVLPPHGASPSGNLLKNGFLLGLFLLFQALSEFIFASFLILFSVAWFAYWGVARLLASRRGRHSGVASYSGRRNRHSERSEESLADPSSDYHSEQSGQPEIPRSARNDDTPARNDDRSARQDVRLFLALAVAALTFLVPMLPILGAMLSDMQTEGDFIQSGLGFSNVFSADLLGFIIPSHLHPLFGGLEAQFSFSYINFVYLGFVALAFALLALWRAPRARLWGVFFLIIFLITLGPTLRVNGAEYNLPFLPFNLLLDIPIIKGNRYPSRWVVMLTLCLAMIVGYGVQILNSKFEGRKSEKGIANGELGVAQRPITNHKSPITNYKLPLTALVILLLLFENASFPLPTTDLRVPSVYQTIANDAGNFAVMELPLAWRNGFRVTGSYRADSQAPIDREFMLAQWYQSAQGHPILNGNTSRNPELKFQYFAETPVLDSLIAIQTGHAVDDATRARDRELAPRLLQFLNVRYIVWHSPYEDANRDAANKTRAYVEEVLPVKQLADVHENGKETALYRVNAAPPSDSFTLKPDDPLARLYFGEGWGTVGASQIAMTRTSARIFVPIDTPRDLKLTLLNVRASNIYALNASVDGVAVGPNLLVPAMGQYDLQFADRPVQDWTLNIPARALHAGVNEIDLWGEDAKPVPVNQTGNVKVQIAGETIESFASLVVRSAGEEQGDFGHIYLNGVDESPNARGYNIVVIAPETGKVESRASFDVLASADNAARLAEFIDAIPNGRLVAVAVRDEASTNLSGEAVKSLRSIGGQVDLRGKFRWSHALIGIKGAVPESALEASSETDVSQLVLGLGATEPTVVGAIGGIKIEPGK